VKANASKHKALSYEHACKLEAQIKAEVDRLLQKAEAADVADVPDGLNIPAEFERREERLAAIQIAKAEIERRAAERCEREKAAYKKKVAQREQKEQETGKKSRGKQLKPPTPGPIAKDQVNLTDEDSRIMPTSGGFEQCYNAQAGVDVTTKIIVSAHVTQEPNDKQQMKPTLEKLAALPRELGEVTGLISDNGYFSEANVQACESQGITPYIAVDREHHNQDPWDRFREPPALPEDADAVSRMKHRLKTAAGKTIYALRKVTSEPVFGIIKAVLGFRSFRMRGSEAADGEWNLVCMAWNIKRLHALTR